MTAIRAEMSYGGWQETGTNVPCSGVGGPIHGLLRVLSPLKESAQSEAILAAQAAEPALRCYEATRDSGVLRFWDEPEEDVYTMSDGQPA